MPNPKKRCSGCPVAFSLDTFGDKWSFLIVRDMIFRGKETYGEFLEGGEGIATNILADRLKQLEASGIIQKSRDTENLRRNLYTLTEQGYALIPIILEMIRWAGKYDKNTRVSSTMLQRITNDRENFEAEIRSRLNKK